MKKKTYVCQKCPRLKFVNTQGLAKHFKKNPDHRSSIQKSRHKAGIRRIQLRGGRRRSGIYDQTSHVGLPTIKGRKGIRAGNVRFCTQCGTRRMPSHGYCGNCGVKI